MTLLQQHRWSRPALARLMIINLTSFMLGCWLSRFSPPYSHIAHPEMISNSAAPATKMLISFSLYGNDSLYTTGAIRNAEQIPALYPGWRSRFYIDESVPVDVVQQLNRTAAAEIVRISHDQNWMQNGRLWRYLALDDPEVRLVMFRDCDTRITTRELQAVNKWIESDYDHHIIRDHPDQVQIIVPGQWSATASFIRSQVSIRRAAQSISLKYSTSDDRSMEDMFLTDFIWPAIRSNVLVHDTFNCDLFESEMRSQPFPGPREWHGDYVGRRVVERFDYSSDYFINSQREFYGGIAPEDCRLSPEHIEG